MPRRSIWSARQRAALFDLPTDEAALLCHYTLSDDDIEQIRLRRGAHNRLGFALQLCAFRYTGRILAAGEAIPLNVLRFIAPEHGMGVEDLDGYGIREERSWEHVAELRRIYGHKVFSGRSARELKVWLEDEAEPAPSNEGLARRFVSDQTATVRRSVGRPRGGGPHLAPGLGSHTADRGISVAETPLKWPRDLPSPRNSLLAKRIDEQILSVGFCPLP